MRKALLLLSLLSCLTIFGQVGIGTSSPNPSSQLEIVATNKGLLIPRVSLTSTTDATTISSGNVNSLLVFNTQTVSDISPGYYYWYINKWIRLGISGNITNLIDNGDGTITYTNELNIKETINIAQIVKNYETLTSATFNSTTGILTYVDEHNVSTVLNLSTMIPNFETLTSISQNVAAGTITYIDEKGVSTVLDIVALIKQHETLTSATFDPTTGILTYVDEHNVSTTLNLSTMISNFETLTSISQDVAAGTITYVDEKGVSTVLDIAALIKQHETLTSATFDATTGILTYNDEDGTANTLNLSSMIANFETLTAISHDVAAGTITYVDEDGASTVLDIAALINANTTVSNASLINTATVTVNGVTSTGAPIVNSNTLTAVDGNLISTVNGVASAPAVSILTTANNGLTATNGNIQLGGALIAPTTITADVTNTLAIAGLQPSTASTDKVVVTDAAGVLKNASGVMPKFFYMPAITFDTSIPATGQTINLYQEYINQFSNVAVRSAGAPAAIPFLPAASDLYYYVTYFDPAVFANLSVDANGVLTYDIIGSGTPSSYLNIVFVIK